MTTEVKTELKRLLENSGGGLLKPASVVEAARDPKSPLHSHFEWDDRKASEKYRLMQARHLIRVCVEYIGPENEQLRSRIFVSLSTDRPSGGGYRTAVQVFSDEQQRQILLADAREQLRLFQRKYGDLQELARIFEAIAEVDQAA